MKNMDLQKIKASVAWQLLSMDAGFEQAETIVLERIVKPEMCTRAAVTDNKRHLNPSRLDRVMEDVLVEVFDMMGEISWLKRCRRWVTANKGVSFVSFQRVMNCQSDLPVLVGICQRLQFPDDWTRYLVSGGDDDLLNPEMNSVGDAIVPADDVDCGRMIERAPMLDEGDGTWRDALTPTLQ